MKPQTIRTLVRLTGLCLLVLASFHTLAQEMLVYTQAQAEAGKLLYREHCQKCHGSTLSNGQFGTPLKGAFFRNTWREKTVGELLQYMFEEMPSDVPSRLSREQYADVAAYIFLRNDFPAGEAALPADPDQSQSLPLPF